MFDTHSAWPIVTTLLYFEPLHLCSVLPHKEAGQWRHEAFIWHNKINKSVTKHENTAGGEI